MEGKMNSESESCPVCKSYATVTVSHDPVKIFVQCPVCGRFEYYPMTVDIEEFNLNHLASYFVYNGFKDNIFKKTEYKYFTTMSKEMCDEYRAEFNKGNTVNGHPVHLSADNVENWYPKRLSDKIDLILTYLHSRSNYIGETIKLEKETVIGCLFLVRYKQDRYGHNQSYTDELEKQASYMYEYLTESNLIKPENSWTGGFWGRPIQLTPEAYSRIDKIEKDKTHGKDVLVAMQFGDKTKRLREAIRQGITEAEYNPVFIDEVEHNDFITPELLKYIRDSKFVVVDLSHQNNGAYFEEGYAMGLGKPVIQLCKKEVRLHFDIAQKNTIIWEDEEEVPFRLRNRIIATIE